MKWAEKLFFETKMSWKRVLVLAVACGIVPGLLMLPAFLKDTSLQQPGISFEFWILAALYIILNCQKPLEAGYKTFVFFLISQPIIYLVQVPFSTLGWGLFSYYRYWAIWTVLTFPGAMVAWYVRKGNLLSVLILSVANIILCMEIPYLAQTLFASFPHLLLSELFIIAEVIFFICLLFHGKKERALAFALAVLLLLFGIWASWFRNNTPEQGYATILEGKEPFTLTSGCEGLEAEIRGSMLWVFAEQYGSYSVEVADADGVSRTITFVLDEEDGDFFPAG